MTTVPVQVTDTRVIVLQPRGPNSWTVFTGTQRYEVADHELLDPLRIDSKCNLKLSTIQRTRYLQTLLAALGRAGIHIELKQGAA